MRRLPAAIIILALVTTACGGVGDNGASPGATDNTTAAFTHPTGADQLILSQAMGGGFVPIEYNLQAMPGFSLYGDGTVLTQGPMIEIYPPPAMPNIQQQTVTEGGIQAILAAADEAGLLDGDHEYTAMTQYAADVGTTTFTVNANDTENVTSIYGLGMAANNPDGQSGFEIPQDELDADAALSEFSGKLMDLQSWLPEGSVSESTEYEPMALRYYFQPYGKGDPNLEQEPVDWPLSYGLHPEVPTPPPSIDDPGLTRAGSGCGVVQGKDLETAWRVAEGTNTMTPWVSGGETYRLVFRPLLPGESATCDRFPPEF